MTPLGVGLIEGFYGAPWTDAARNAQFEHLGSVGAKFFIHAPKADRYLRGDWQERHPPEAAARLEAMGRACKAAGLKFGLGLTPLRLHEDLAGGRAHVVRRVEALSALGIDVLAVRFDDMPGAFPNLATTQATILAWVRECAPNLTLAMCPTYYTSHDILDRVYGQRPTGYLAELGAALDSDVHIFWTGPRVCSTEYPLEHLHEVSKQLGRKPLIWDNYPVNDGERMCQRLHLGAPIARGPAVLANTSGLAINPMNACWLSQLPIHAMVKAALGTGPTDPARATRCAFEALLPPKLADTLLADVEAFSKPGAQPGFSTAERGILVNKYTSFDHPSAQEAIRWLRGEFQVGPECITDAD